MQMQHTPKTAVFFYDAEREITNLSSEAHLDGCPDSTGKFKGSG